MWKDKQKLSSKQLGLVEKQLMCLLCFLWSSTVPWSCASFQRGTQESGIRALAFCKLLLLTGKRLIRDMGCERPLWGGEIEELAELRGECLHYNRWEIRLAPTSLLGCRQFNLTTQLQGFKSLGGWNFQVTCFYFLLQQFEKLDSFTPISPPAVTSAPWLPQALRLELRFLASCLPEAGQWFAGVTILNVN